MTCTVDGCSRPVKAKALCGTHYQRLRRTGDANKVRKPGRPKDPFRKHWEKSMGSDFGSSRTMDRFIRAHRLARFVGEHRGDGWREKLMAFGLRPNGSINVSEYLANAEYHAALVLDTYYPPNGAESVAEGTSPDEADES